MCTTQEHEWNPFHYFENVDICWENRVLASCCICLEFKDFRRTFQVLVFLWVRKNFQTVILIIAVYDLKSSIANIYIRFSYIKLVPFIYAQIKRSTSEMHTLNSYVILELKKCLKYCTLFCLSFKQIAYLNQNYGRFQSRRM